MTVPPALLSHESTEHYTLQSILDAVIACMGAIDLDPASNSHEIPNVPAARHYTAQDNGLVQPWVGRVFLDPPFGPVSSGGSRSYTRSGPRGHGGDCAVEVGDRDRSMEDADGIIVPGVLSFSPDRFVGPAGDGGPGPTFHRRCSMLGRDRSGSTSVCRDWGGVGGSEKKKQKSLIFTALGFLPNF